MCTELATCDLGYAGLDALRVRICCPPLPIRRVKPERSVTHGRAAGDSRRMETRPGTLVCLTPELNSDSLIMTTSQSLTLACRRPPGSRGALGMAASLGGQWQALLKNRGPMLLIAPGLHRPGLSLKLHPPQSEKMPPLSLRQYLQGESPQWVWGIYNAEHLPISLFNRRTDRQQGPGSESLFKKNSWSPYLACRILVP